MGRTSRLKESFLRMPMQAEASAKAERKKDMGKIFFQVSGC